MDCAFIREIMVAECDYCTRKNYLFHDRNNDSSKEMGGFVEKYFETMDFSNTFASSKIKQIKRYETSEIFDDDNHADDCVGGNGTNHYGKGSFDG